MKLSLFLILLTALSSALTAMDSETFQPIQRITNFPIRDTSYMGPFRNTLEEKVQTLMKQRRKVSTLSATESNNNNNNAKVKTLVPRSVITNLSAKRPAVVAATPTLSPSSSENYNELFLDLSQMSVKPKKKLHHLAAVKTSSNSIKPLNAKKSTTNELAGKAQSEYFQSDSFKKNKSRQNNPLRLKRLQLLHDQSFLEKHQKLGSFIFSKNQDNLDLIAMATTTTIATTTSQNQIQAAKQANKKNRKLTEATAEEKSNTFQNRLPNLRDSSSSESQNAKIIFNAKEKLEDLNRNETSSLEEEVEEKNELKETKPKSEFETQSTLINDEERAAARKRFRDPAKKANTETDKSNTLSMQRHFNPNAQQQHQQFHHHNNHLQQQQQQQQQQFQNHFNHQQHQQINRQDMFKPLSLKKPTNIDHPLRPNNYFEAKERLLSTQGPNAEYYKPSNYYQHNKVPNINDLERMNQQQGPLPSGFHFKLLKSKRPQAVATEVIVDTLNPAAKTETDNVDKAKDQVDTIVQTNANEEKLVENVVAKEVDVNVVVNEPAKEETAQVVETQREEVMINKDDEPVLTNAREEVQVEKEEFVKDKETDVLDSVSSQETLKETESVVA